MTTSCRWWASLLTIAAGFFVFVGGNPAQEKKVHEKHDSAALYDSLRDVIDQGAGLYNDNGDYPGCYRMFQGSLLTVRPFLAPSLQKKIDEGMARAEKLPTYAERALSLRKVLGEIREQVKPASVDKKVDDTKKVEDKKKIEDPKKIDDKKKDDVKKIDDKKKDDVKKIDDKKIDDKKKDDTKKIDDKKKDDTKKIDDKKKEDKKIVEPPVDPKLKEKGQLSGKLTFQGKPVSGGYFVTLVSKEGKKFSSTIQKDGSFQFSTPIPVGEYRVAVEPVPAEKGIMALPPRYQSESTSGLVVSIQAGKQQRDLNLMN